MCRVRTAHRAGFHPIGLLNGENAPLMDAMATQSVDIAFIVGWPAGAALNPEPRSWLNRPFRVGLPPAVKHPVRGYIHPSWGAEARRHPLNLLLSLFFWVTEVCHLQHHREQSSLIGLSIQHRSMWVIMGCSELSRHNEQSHQRTVAWSRNQKWQVCLGYHISKWSTTGHQRRWVSHVIAPKHVCKQREKGNSA